MTGPVTVTQADREAAAEFSATVARCSMKEPQIADCLAGKQDNTLIVQAFARHRLAAEERGARMALEAAAKVFEAEADTWVQTPLRGAMKRKGATAIRQTDPAQIVKG